MERLSKVVCLREKPHKDFFEISECTFKSRSAAYDALDRWIKKHNISSCAYHVVDAEKCWSEEFDTPDQYLDYLAYIN